CLRHRDGSAVHVLANLSMEAEGGEVVIHGTIVDITERMVAERRMAVEHAVSLALSESAALSDAAPRILQAIGDGLGWDLGALWTVDPSADELRCVEVWHVPRVEASAFIQACHRQACPRGIGLPGRIWASGTAAWFPDVSRESNFPRAPFAIR